MIQLTGVKLSVNSDETKLKKKICQVLKINPIDIISIKMIKRSLDARKKDNIIYVYNVVLELKNENKILAKGIKNVSIYNEPTYNIEKVNSKKRIAVIGYGPAGMFTTLCLAEAGLNVTVFERGQQVDERVESVDKFWKEGVLNIDSNVQFGEGGAGTFSDGKLTTRSKNIRITKVFKEFVDSGAPEEIMYVHNPHIGTDKLRDVVKNIRNKSIELGAKFNFNSKVQRIIFKDDEVKGLIVNGKEYEFDIVILAVGHSSRDTFEMLCDEGVDMRQKPFAVGFRIEHPQTLINKAQFGENYDIKRLGPAEYKLTNQTKDKRGVYTFCMCPGGFVVPSQSERDTIVVNGMSEYARNQVNANSALLVTVDSRDFKSEHPLAGIEFQREIERKAFILGGSNYNAPVQRLKDFIDDKVSTDFGNVLPSYKIGTTFANLRSIYSKDINDAIIESIEKLDNKVKGFSLDDAILTGVETRTSSPIRIERDKVTLESENKRNLYPCGEGSGHAGGIVSAAVDGIRVSEQIIEKLKDK